MNSVAKKIQDAIFLTVHNLVDDWMMDSGALFQSTSHREIMHNYVASDFGKMYTVGGEAQDIVGVGDLRIALLNRSSWTL